MDFPVFWKKKGLVVAMLKIIRDITETMIG